VSCIAEVLPTSAALSAARLSIIFCIFSITQLCTEIYSSVFLLSSSALLFSSSALLLSSSNRSSIFLLSSSHFSIILFIRLLNAASWDKRDADDAGERKVGLIDSGPSPVPRTRPDYSAIPITIASATSSAHSIEPCGKYRVHSCSVIGHQLLKLVLTYIYIYIYIY
jgi:hypothetical protein